MWHLLSKFFSLKTHQLQGVLPGFLGDPSKPEKKSGRKFQELLEKSAGRT
jgi:hypothetical protein